MDWLDDLINNRNYIFEDEIPHLIQACENKLILLEFDVGYVYVTKGKIKKSLKIVGTDKEMY